MLKNEKNIAQAKEFAQSIKDEQGITAQNSPVKFIDIIRDDIGNATVMLEDQRKWYRRTDLDDTFDRITRDEIILNMNKIDYQKFMKLEINTKAHYLDDFDGVAQNKREAIYQEEDDAGDEDDEDNEVIKELDREAYKQEKQAQIVKSFPSDKVMREFHGEDGDLGDVKDNFSLSYHPLDGDTLHYYMDELSEALFQCQDSLK